MQGGFLMSKKEIKYVKEANGDFVSHEDFMQAVKNGELVKLRNGVFLDPKTGEEYWSDGTLKESGWETEEM